MLLPVLIAGFGGGALRGIVGFIKHQFSYADVEFKINYFFGMVFISGIVGILTAAAVKNLGLSIAGVPGFSPALAFVIGYAGGDFLENVYKIITKKTDLPISKQTGQQ